MGFVEGTGKAGVQLPNKYDFVAIVGHNPGIGYILYHLTGQIKDVHTSTVAVIDFETDDWAAVSGETGKLAYFSGPSL